MSQTLGLACVFQMIYLAFLLANISYVLLYSFDLPCEIFSILFITFIML